MSVLDLIFPKTCLECGKVGKYICGTCLDKVPEVGWHKTDSYSIWGYKGVVRKAILALKYKYSTEIAIELAEGAVKRLKTENFELKDTLLVPIPIHWHKRNLRGFNQSEELGRIITKGLSWKFLPDLLVKKKATRSQVELKGQDRRNNLIGSFELNPDLKIADLRGKTIVIFDDVYTTGSTISEAEKLLKTLNIKQILNLTIAK